MAADLDAAIRAKLAADEAGEAYWPNYKEAIEAVLDLHKPFPNDVAPGELVCGGCTPDLDNHYVSTAWPCETVRDIAKALGVEVERGGSPV